MNNKRLLEFKEAVREEFARYHVKGIKGPLLDRLQIHLDTLDTDYDFYNLFVAKNMESELYLSMLYQIIYPAKKIQKFSIEVDGKILKEEKNPKQTGVALLKELDINILKTHPKFGKYVFNTKEEFYEKYSNNVTLLEVSGVYLSVLHILYSSGNNTLDKITNFIENINKHLKYQKIKIYDDSYYQL